MFKSKNIPVDGTVLERDRIVFKERNLFGRVVREVIEQRVYRNQGKILDTTTIIVQRPSKRRIWKVLRDFMQWGDDKPVEIMIREKEILIRDGNRIVSEVEDTRKELNGHEVEV